MSLGLLNDVKDINDQLKFLTAVDLKVLKPDTF